MRVTECREEAWSISYEPMDKSWIERAAEQGERVSSRESLVIRRINVNPAVVRGGVVLLPGRSRRKVNVLLDDVGQELAKRGGRFCATRTTATCMCAPAARANGSWRD